MRVWEGNAALSGYLVAVATLTPHPRNPRLGNVEEIGRSLERFGQQRPILANREGTIVAGHHVYRAALARGWTHIAVTRTDLTDEEIDAYLLADNGTADRSYYDERGLAELLAQWDDYAGTGFSKAEAEHVISAMLWMPDGLERAPTAGAPRDQPLATGEAAAFNIVLTYDDERYGRVAAACDRLLERHGGSTYADAIRGVIVGAA